MKPVQYAHVSCVAHFSRPFFFLKFETNEYFHFLYFFRGKVGVGGGGCSGDDR